MKLTTTFKQDSKKSLATLFGLVPNILRPYFPEDIIDAVAENDLELVKKIIKKRPSFINCPCFKIIGKDNQGNDKYADSNIFSCAIHMRHDEIAEYLFSKGANIKPKYDRPLLAAACSNAKEIALKLISKGVNVNLKDGNGDTALHDAVTCKSNDIVKILISAGTDLNLKNHDGKTALDIANDSNEEAANIIKEALNGKLPSKEEYGIEEKPEESKEFQEMVRASRERTTSGMDIV